MALAVTFPKLVVISVYGKPERVYYKNESEIVCGEDEGVFSTLVKIEVELAKIDNNLVHLRFSYTNKYCARDADGWIVAKSNQPEEDESKSTCTLFRPTFGQGQLFYLHHVQSGGSVQVTDSGRLYVDHDPSYYKNSFEYQDLEAFVKLPNNLAFKGDNGKYLKAFLFGISTVLQFSSDDPNDELSGHEVQQMPDGYVRIKSRHTGKFWMLDDGKDFFQTLGPNWISAESIDAASNDNTLFWPIKIDDRTIALRSKGNNNFCKSDSNVLVADLSNCLKAVVPTITTEARLVVHELVLDRKIYNVTYQMEYARIYDVQPYLAGKTTAVNNEDVEASVSVSITYQDESSYSFAKTLTVTADVLGIAKGAVEFSFSVSGSFEWNNTTTTTKSITATGAVPVPPRSTVVVSYVGSKGTCDVPFSYTVQSKSSADGSIVRTDEVDGIFTGVNCYDFNFELVKLHLSELAALMSFPFPRVFHIYVPFLILCLLSIRCCSYLPTLLINVVSVLSHSC